MKFPLGAPENAPKNFETLHGRQARRDGSDFLNDHFTEARGEYTAVIGLHSPVRITRVKVENRAMDVTPHGEALARRRPRYPDS